MTPLLLVCKTSSAISVLLISGCASLAPRPEIPRLQLCEVQANKGGIECALSDKKQVFFKWTELKDKFLVAFDRQIILTQDGFKTLVGMAHKK